MLRINVATNNGVRYIVGYWDETADAYRLGARYYDADTGRFTQYDPSGQEANPYNYAGCNPINSKDPTGLLNCSGIVGLMGIGHAALWAAAMANAGVSAGASIAVAAGISLG